MAQKLTEHFTLEELSRSSTAVRQGLDNTPPANLLPNLKRIAEHLEIVRAHFGWPITVYSGYRSPAVNEAVGGSKTSAHRFGLAADFVVQGVPNRKVCEWIRDNLKDFDQVIYEFGPKGWVHLGLAAKPRKQALTAVKENGKTVYKPGIRELWG